MNVIQINSGPPCCASMYPMKLLWHAHSRMIHHKTISLLWKNCSPTSDVYNSPPSGASNPSEGRYIHLHLDTKYFHGNSVIVYQYYKRKRGNCSPQKTRKSSAQTLLLNGVETWRFLAGWYKKGKLR